MASHSVVKTRDALLLLAMCPLLAVSDTVVNALGMGLLVLVAAPASAAVYLAVQRRLTSDVRVAGAVLALAGVVACIEVVMRAWLYDLRSALDVFTPLVIANCALIGAMAGLDDPPRARFRHVVRLSLAIAAMLLVLGAARELVGRGSLLHDAGLMFGVWARGLETKVFSVDMGFLLGMLPPGAFISLGLLLALLNWLRRT